MLIIEWAFSKSQHPFLSTLGAWEAPAPRFFDGFFFRAWRLCNTSDRSETRSERTLEWAAKRVPSTERVICKEWLVQSTWPLHKRWLIDCLQWGKKTEKLHVLRCYTSMIYDDSVNCQQNSCYFAPSVTRPAAKPLKCLRSAETSSCHYKYLQRRPHHA